jgi:hypothetical protein
MAAALIPILIAVIPELPGLAESIIALWKKYPQLTPEQITTAVFAVVSQSDAAFASVDAKIAADEAAHPPTPVV